MRRIREVLRLKLEFGLNDSQVARSAGIGRTTVQDYLRRISATGVPHGQLLARSDEALEQRLFRTCEHRNTNRPIPDWESIESELRGRGVTLRLLWQEAVLWAGAYLLLGAVDSMADAMLYSVDQMTTRGASGVTLQHHWRMMGALEAANGMFGVSTAFVFAVLAHVWRQIKLLGRRR